jgi:hypothetical protein
LFPKNARSGASLALALLSLCCAAAVARAEGEETHLNLDLTVEQDYDSNVFTRERDEIGSAVTIVRPSIGLESYGTLGHALLTGWLSSHTYWSESELNGVDRGVAADIDRTILPRIALFGSGSYQRIAPHNEVRGPDIVTISGAPGAPGEPVVSPGELVSGAVPNLDLGQAEIGARYALSPRSRLSLSGGPYSLDYLEGSQPFSQFRDQSGWFTRLSLLRNLSQIDSLRATLGASSAPLDDFSNTGLIHSGTTDSDQQNLSLGWERHWNELWTTSLTIGVRRLESATTGASRPITFAEFDPGAGAIVGVTRFVPTDFDSVGPGIIGGFTIERVMPRGGLALSYQRETRTTSSLFASDVNVDTITASYIHKLSARATLSLLGSYEHYESIEESPQVLPATYLPGSFNPITGPEFACADGTLMISGSGASKGGQCEVKSRRTLSSNSWFASARLDWQLRKRLSTYAIVRYENRYGDDLLFGNDYDRFTVGVGFNYAYDLGL